MSDDASSTDLRERHVVLTGASRGIGRAIALRLARAGAALTLCARDAAALESVLDEARALGAAYASGETFDLSDAVAIEQFCSQTCAKRGPVDVLINNAGYNSRKAPVHEVEVDEFDAIMAVNLRAPFLMVRAILPQMIERRAGHIVNILSTVCEHDNETMGAYTAAKQGMRGWHGVLLKEARGHGVRVSGVYPGGTDTEFRPKARPDYMRPESVAEAVYSVLAMPEDLIVQSITFRPIVETNF